MFKLSKKKYFLSALVLFFAAVLSFITLYSPSLIETKSNILGYIGHFASKFINSAMPVVSAAILTLTTYGSGFSKKLIWAIPLALAKIGYLLPYAFMIFSAQYEVYFATVISVIYTLVFMILYLAEITVYSLIICAFINRGFKNQKIKPTPVAPMLDLDAPVTLGVLFATLSRFVVDIILEIIDTIEYLVQYAGTYRLGEIIYMIFSYIAILLFAIATHFVACAVKNALAK